MASKFKHFCLGAAVLALSGIHSPVVAQAPVAPTYADLAGLSESSDLVVHAQIKKLARVDDSRVSGLEPGFGRFYVVARTMALLTGSAPLGESFSYLVDLRLDAKGKPPKLKNQEVLLFARPVAGRAGELQLVSPRAQLPWSEVLEGQVRPILKELVSADVPPRITGVREIIFVPGTLAGEGETQIFLSTADSSAASITVHHEPGVTPAWGVSFSELVAMPGNVPAKDTLAWYHLACFLPRTLSPSSNHSDSAAASLQAELDYRMVIGQLGACPRALN